MLNCYRRMVCLVIALSGLQMALAVPAHASSLMVLGGSMSASLMMFINPNLCITYSYDLNGNRTAQTNATYGTPGTTWGSAVYACFDWTSP
jgi:hypothetical protein